MSGGSALVQFAKSLSPRFNFHFSFCSRSKRQSDPSDRREGERGEAPRQAVNSEQFHASPHPLSLDSPLSASSADSPRSQSDQHAPLPNEPITAIASELPGPAGWRRTDSTASTSSASSVTWIPPPWEGQSRPIGGAGTDIMPHSQGGLLASHSLPDGAQVRVPSPAAFDTDCECPICLDRISNADLEPLTGCEHILHAHCLRDLLLHAQADCLLPSRCPVAGCRSEILDPDIRRVLPPPAYSSYRSAEWRQYVDSHPADFVRCPTANCTFVFAWSEADYTAAPYSALCPECQHAYCLRCRCNWHPRASCEESAGRAQDWQRTERVLSGLGFRRCRQCRHWVEKSSGCNKITCRCGYRFCHKCGSENARCNCSSIFHVFYPQYMVLSNWK